MIQSIRALGQSVRRALPDDPAEVVEQLALASDDEEPGDGVEQQRYLAVLDVYPAQRLLRHVLVEASSAALRRFLYLNLMKSEPGGDVRDVTVRDLRHLLGLVFVGLAHGLLLGERAGVPARLAELEPVLTPMKPALRDFGQGTDRRARFLLDLDGFRLEPPPAVATTEYLTSDAAGRLSVSWQALERLEPKKRSDALARSLRSLLSWGRDVAYFTLALDGRPLAEEPAYRRYVFWYLVERPFAEATLGHCHLCARERPVTSDFRRFRIKTYIIDKTSFASGLVQAGFTRCYVVCQDCYLDLLLGDRLLEQQLETRLLQTPVFVIPEFAVDAPMNYEAVVRRLALVRQEATELDRLRELRRAPEDLARAGRERSQLYAYLTLLFHEKQNMAVKVREVVAEVPPSRVQAVIVAMNRLNDIAQREEWARPFAHERDGWIGGLRDLLYVLPLRRQRGAPEVRPALTLVRQLLQQEPVDERSLVASFLEAARAIASQHVGYWLVPERWGRQTASQREVDAALRQFLNRTLALRLLLADLGCVTRGGVAVDHQIPEPYRSAVEGLQLNAQERALFLLGVLLGRVAHRQFVDSDGGTKPVLEKLNYSGMSLPRVLTFATELFDKMRQYRLLTEHNPAENELLYSIASLLLAAERTKWRLTDQENVYYLLTGYAYETGRIIQRGGQRDATAADSRPQPAAS
ncbi:type I-B CRISPR-associated protein Cas8b/Csh1 [Thermomicrobiaceae bacterium CFH 74404]|uniref:Type I-B CRISPR-associated protein Cas8b/Csh1 n=1 Tax=Thermalbibacter longus TaxID=2951981 RepID=A0AA41WBK8_9BACT|nr:type I-B CRISPR-associated protein Cas8b/Csh1 [Thermalbibacter longus]MCM8747878.1 type I-B CRISPR-associated protein Cas8b/Csh1 [Thermalbibacter longus]